MKKSLILLVGVVLTVLIAARSIPTRTLVHDWALVGNVGEVGQSYAGHIYAVDDLGVDTDIAYYKFLSTDMLSDETSNSNDLTVGAGSPTNSDGIFGSDNAVYFDGDDAYQAPVFNTPSTLNNGIGISFWVKFTDGQPPTTQFVFQKKNVGETDRIYFYLNAGGNLTFVTTQGGTGVAVDGLTIFPNGVTDWYHIAVNWDTTNGIRIWTNGVLEATASQTTLMADGSATQLVFGANVNFDDDMQGYIALLKLQDIVYTQKDVDQMYAVKYEIPGSFKTYKDFGIRYLAKEDGDDNFISEINWGGMEVKRTDDYIYRYGGILDAEDKFKMWLLR